MSNPKENINVPDGDALRAFKHEFENFEVAASQLNLLYFVSFIVFTAANPDNPETLNNRKTSRQIFAYKPNNGLLLQSRLYNTNGGTYGSHSDSKLYRDSIQRELSELEGVPNLWQTEKYCNNKHGINIHKGHGFGGYADWHHADFNAKISIRVDHSHDFKTFDVGTYGLCISCADEISEGLYCSECDPDEREFCQECESSCRETFDVINRHGEFIHVCENCLERYYKLCEHCEQYYPVDEVSTIANGENICHHCLSEDYDLCHECDEYFLQSELSHAVDANGEDILICESCRYNREVPA